MNNDCTIVLHSTDYFNNITGEECTEECEDDIYGSTTTGG